MSFRQKQIEQSGRSRGRYLPGPSAPREADSVQQYLQHKQAGVSIRVEKLLGGQSVAPTARFTGAPPAESCLHSTFVPPQSRSVHSLVRFWKPS